MKRTHLLLCVGAGLLAASAYRNFSGSRRRRVVPAAPRHIQTWESEGGGVPVTTNRTAGQLPAVPAADIPGEKEGELRAALALSPLGPSVPPV